jgi:hypothetical protein
MYQLFGFALEHMCYRDACPAGNQFGYILFYDDFPDVMLFQPFALGGVVFVLQSQPFRLEFCCTFVILPL